MSKFAEIEDEIYQELWKSLKFYCTFTCVKQFFNKILKIVFIWTSNHKLMNKMFTYIFSQIFLATLNFRNTSEFNVRAIFLRES